MGTITAIKPQVKNKERVSIFLDGQFAFGLHLSVATGLRVGQQLDDQQLAALLDAEAYARARQQALAYLARRSRSVAELTSYLEGKEVPAETVAAIVADFQERNYLDDLAFARYWVEQRETFKPRGARALRQELRQKGVANETIDAALADLDELDAARRAAQSRARRWRHLPWEAFRQKLGSFLQRRGFGYDIVRQVVNECWQDHKSEIEEGD